MSFSLKSGLAGLICGVILTCLIGADAPAPVPPAPATPRYQIDAWAHAGHPATGGRNDEPGHHGAYRIDTLSGEVVAIDETGVSMKIEIAKN